MTTFLSRYVLSEKARTKDSVDAAPTTCTLLTGMLTRVNRDDLKDCRAPIRAMIGAQTILFARLLLESQENMSLQSFGKRSNNICPLS